MTVKIIKFDNKVTWGMIAAILVFLLTLFASYVGNEKETRRDIEDLKTQIQQMKDSLNQDRVSQATSKSDVDAKLSEVKTGNEVVKSQLAVMSQQMTVMQTDMRNIYSILVKEKIAQRDMYSIRPAIYRKGDD